MKKTIVLPIIGILCLALVGTGILASNLNTRLAQTEDELWEAKTIAVHLIADYLPEEEWVDVYGLTLLLATDQGTYESYSPGWKWMDGKEIYWEQVVRRFGILR